MDNVKLPLEDVRPISSEIATPGENRVEDKITSVIWALGGLNENVPARIEFHSSICGSIHFV